MVNSVRFSPDGRMLLSTGGYSTDEARLFDLARRKARWAHDEQAERRFCGAAFTPDGAGLLTCEHPAGCQLLNVATLAEMPFPLKDAPVRPFAHPIFSPDGTRLLARAELWEAGPRLHWWAYPSWEPLTTWTVGIEWCLRPCWPVFSPDGLTLADVTGPHVTLYDVATGQEMRRLRIELKQGQAAMAFDPSGRLLTLASGRALAVWDVAAGQEVATLRQNKKYFLGVAFTADGRFLGSVSNEETVKLWDTSSWRLAREYAWQIGGLKCLAFSGDGQLAAAGSDKKRIVVWDLDD
jgi:WD40 repeat protein